VGRILFARAIDTDNLNAQSSNAREILRRWRSQDWRPSVLSFREPDPAVASNPNVDIIRLRPDRWWRIKLFEIYQRSFDAIFYPGMHHRADYLALRARKASGRSVPVVSTIEGLSGRQSDDSREGFYSAHAGHAVFCQKLAPSHLSRVEWVNRDASHIIAISPFLERMADAKYGAKVSHIPLGIDGSLWHRRDRTQQSRRRVVTAGNVRAHKRPELFLELARAFPAADFCWYGEGELRLSLVGQAREIGLENVSFPGAIGARALAQEFASANIFVLPSKSEGVPKVTQEAAAAGLAQIVFGFYETPSVVDGANGFVVWSDDEFKARLDALLNNPDQVDRLGRAGMKMAESWSWDRVAPLWEQRIIECAESHLRSVAARPAQRPAAFGIEGPN
jgi:glycosyltransferase involved in cell wall biosynthesis